jgi:hypothetical protein
VVRAADVAARTDDEPPWLIESLWGALCVGVIGGSPKSGKTWIALEMAVAVASGRPFLGRFGVPRRGPVLVFAAEDAPVSVRERLEHLSIARGADFATLDVHLILESVVRLDQEEDRARLRATVKRYEPRLLVLDPYVRLQSGVDENDATQVSAILGSLREISRAEEVAIALVHHTRKGGAAEDRPGQGLRGSGDFHAWGDSLLSVRRRSDSITLSVEHRAAASPPPLTLELVDDDGPVRLEIREDAAPSRSESSAPSIAERILRELEEGGPLRKLELRERLRVRNHDLARELTALEAAARIARTPRGWVRSGSPAP